MSFPCLPAPLLSILQQRAQLPTPPGIFLEHLLGRLAPLLISGNCRGIWTPACQLPRAWPASIPADSMGCTWHLRVPGTRQVGDDGPGLAVSPAAAVEACDPWQGGSPQAAERRKRRTCSAVGAGRIFPALGTPLGIRPEQAASQEMR